MRWRHVLTGTVAAVMEYLLSGAHRSMYGLETQVLVHIIDGPLHTACRASNCGFFHVCTGHQQDISRPSGRSACPLSPRNTAALRADRVRQRLEHSLARADREKVPTIEHVESESRRRPRRPRRALGFRCGGVISPGEGGDRHIENPRVGTASAAGL